MNSRLINFRPVAGRGTVFRAGDLSRATAEDARRLRQEHNLQVYVDLRTPPEVVEQGEPTALVEAGVRWVRLSVDLADEEFRRAARLTDEVWGSMYLRGLRRHREQYTALLAALVETDGAVVFGCAAGKDRTGLGAALALLLAGEAEEVIVEDYAATTAGLSPHLDRWRSLWGTDAGLRASMVMRYFVARPGIMRDLLQRLRSSRAHEDLALDRLDRVRLRQRLGL